MMASPRHLAQLDGAHLAATVAAQAALGGASCFDAAQSGDSLWIAVSSSSSVHVLHAPATARSSGRSSGGSGGGLHSIVGAPEVVALAQLGAPSGGSPAADAGVAVLLVVGASCRVWAYQLHPAGRETSTGKPFTVLPLPDSSVRVPLAQPSCPARYQLAAAVAWEHLCCCWDPAQAPTAWRQGSGKAPLVQPLSLGKLGAALRRYAVGWQRSGEEEQQVPLLVHSVASWVCQPVAQAAVPAAAGKAAVASPAAAIPADCTAAAYVGLSAAAGGTLPRLACSARFELPPAVAAAAAAVDGSSTAPAGLLLLATAAGRLLALPVGTPYGRGSSTQQQPLAGGRQRHRLPLAVCYSCGTASDASAGAMCFLPLPPSAGSNGSGSSHGDGLAQAESQQLVLLPEAGRLELAALAGLGSSSGIPMVLSNGCSGSESSGSGSSGGSGGSGGSEGSGVIRAEQLFAATVQLVGVQAAVASSSRLWYVEAPMCGDGEEGRGRRLRCMDASGGLLQAAAVEVGPAVRSVALLAATAAPPGSTQEQEQQQQLVALTAGGTLLAVPASGSYATAAAASSLQQLSVGRLEQTIQALLGSVAELSAQQERLQQQLVALDGSLAGLSAAIPTAQAVAARGGAAVAAAGARLHCTVRLLGLRSQALCSGGSDPGGSYTTGIRSSSQSSDDLLALELSLLNQSRLPLEGSWSVVLAYEQGANSGSSSAGCLSESSSSSSSCGGGSSWLGSSVVLAAPLCGLPAGAAWRQECQVPVAAGLGTGRDQLRVMLCRHGGTDPTGGSSSSIRGGEGSTSRSSTSLCSSTVLLLHSTNLDALHYLKLQPTARQQQQQQQLVQPQASAGAGAASASGAALQAGLLLHLPSNLCGPHAAAGPLLQQLIEQGLSSHPPTLQQQQHAQQTEPLCPAFSLLLPPAAPRATSGGAGSSRQAASFSGGGGPGAGAINLSAQLLPGTAGRGASFGTPLQQQLQLVAEGADAAAVLACHGALCKRALCLQQAAAAAAEAGARVAQPWPQLPNGSMLLPPGAAAAAAAAASASGGGGAWAALGGLLGGFSATTAAVDDRGLEQALVQLRRLREAAVQLRNAAAGQAAGQAAEPEQQQRCRQQQREQLVQLSLAARAALTPVPLLLS